MSPKLKKNPFDARTLAELRRKEAGPSVGPPPPLLTGGQFEWKDKTLNYVPQVKEFFRLQVHPDFEHREIFQWSRVTTALGGDYWIDARLCFYLNNVRVGELPVNLSDNTNSSRFADAKINFFPSDQPESGGHRFIQLLRPNGFSDGFVSTSMLLTGQPLPRLRCNEIAFEIVYQSEAIAGSLSGGDLFLGVLSTPL